MATREIGLERARRQKWLTGLVVGGISITALAVGLTYWGGTNHRTQSAHILPSPAQDVNQQLSGYTFTRSDEGHPVFTVHAARTVSYQQSKSTTLEDVTVEVFGRKGDRGDILRTHRCEYNSQSGDFLSSGPVQIELSAHSSDVPGSGLRGKHRVYLETSKVAYHQEDASKPIFFVTTCLTGSITLTPPPTSDVTQSSASVMGIFGVARPRVHENVGDDFLGLPVDQMGHARRFRRIDDDRAVGADRHAFGFDRRPEIR